jgi:hypothetical protein
VQVLRDDRLRRSRIVKNGINAHSLAGHHIHGLVGIDMNGDRGLCVADSGPADQNKQPATK